MTPPLTIGAHTAISREASEISARRGRYTPSGAGGGGQSYTITSLGLYVEGAVPASNSVQGFTIKMGHTTNTANYQAAGNVATTLSIVYANNAITQETAFETTGLKTFIFGTGNGSGQISSFTWNNLNNLVVEFCTSQNENAFTSAGTGREFASGVDVSTRFSRNDSAGTLCNTLPASYHTNKAPVLVLTGSTGGGPPLTISLGLNSGYTTTGTTSIYPCNVYYRRIVYRSVYNKTFINAEGWN